MQNLVNELREKRLELSEAQEYVSEIKKELEQSMLGLSLIRAMDCSLAISEELKVIEVDLRQAALDMYEKTDDICTKKQMIKILSMV